MIYEFTVCNCRSFLLTIRKNLLINNFEFQKVVMCFIGSVECKIDIIGTLLIDTSFSIESDQVLLPLLEEDDNFAVVLWYGL